MFIKKPIVVGFYGGPGCGKSTLTAATFAALKWQNISCEMALEYAKDVVWEESFNILKNQLYVTSNQHQRLFRLKNQVDVIITDSPLLLSIIYDKGKTKGLTELILGQYEQYDNLNFFVERKKKYDTKGRTQTLEEAIQLDSEIKYILDKYTSGYHSILGIPESVESIVDIIKQHLIETFHIGKVIVITGPSGAGKSTITERLIKENLPIRKCVTTTTRNKRDYEVNSIDYNFVNVEAFSQLVKEDKFVEWEEVYDGSFYGSSVNELEIAWEEDLLPCIVMDVKGATNMKEKYGKDCITIYMDVSENELINRLKNRNSETEHSLQKRIEKFKIEASMKDNFDHIIPEGIIENCLIETKSIIKKLHYKI